MKYKNTIDKLNKAIEYKFYFEALFLLTSIIENITKEHVKNTNSNRITFEESINSLFDDNTITVELKEMLHSWRNERNTLVHNLILKKIEEVKLDSIVTKGQNILIQLEDIR